MLRRLTLAAVLIIGLTGTAFAERRVALILATGDYTSLRGLSNPVNDARSVETLLKSLDFEVWTETDRDLRRMRRALDDFRKDGAGADLALVFYAGHGVAIGGVNYLLPSDAEAKSAAGLAASSLPLSEVHAVLRDISARAIVLLDACRDDPFAAPGSAGAEGRGAVALAGDPPEAPQVQPGLGRMGDAEGVIYAFAAAPGKTASDGSGANSPFTAALLRHLSKGVELREALRLVQQDVYDRSRSAQLPYIESGLPAQIWLSGSADPAYRDSLPERDLLLLAMDQFSPATRAEVEQVARENDMPLAPLFRAVLAGNLEQASAEERGQRLQEAALAYSAFQAELMKYASEDPRVADLRARAEEELALGSHDAALASLDAAEKIDATGRGVQRDGYIARTLSLASTHLLSASAARSALRYPLAIDNLTTATELFTEIRALLPDPASKQAYATAMAELGDLQLVAGNSFGALSIYGSRVDYLQGLMREEPGDSAWARGLIGALQAQGDVMREQGYLRDAGATYRRALALSRPLIAGHPDDPELLRANAALANALGVIFYGLADYPAALEQHQNALATTLLRLDLEPDSLPARRDTAYSEERIGDVHLAAGDFPAARNAFDRSLEITRDLASRFPADGDLQRALSLSYERLGDMSFAEGDRDSALAIYTEALKIRDDLLAKDPGNVLRQRDSTLTWDRIGDIHQALGDTGSALMAYQHALGLREALVALDPQNAVWQRDLSISWERVGELHFSEGDFSGALAAYETCLHLREALVALDPGNLPRQRDLTVALDRMAQSHLALGQQSEARALLETSLATLRQLNAEDEEVLLYRRDIAATLIRLADLERRAGQNGAALALQQEAISLHRAVTTASPGDFTALRELSVALNLQIPLLLDLGQPGEAVALGAESVALMDRVAQLRPHDLKVSFDRMFSAGRHGDALLANGDAEAATLAYRAMARFAWTLSSADPWSVTAARDYAWALEKTGEALSGAGDPGAAGREFQASVDLRRWIAGQKPDSLTDQRALGYALRNLADSWSAQDEAETARPLEEQSLAIMRWIAGTDPANALNHVDLASGLYRASAYYLDGAILLEEAISVLEQLEAEGRMPEGPYRDWLALYRERLEEG